MHFMDRIARADDARCAECGYLLRGLVPDAVCPECGTPTDVPANPLVRCDPVWIAKIVWGLWMLGLAAGAFCYSCLRGTQHLLGFIWLFGNIPLTARANACAVALSCFGAWLLTSRPPAERVRDAMRLGAWSSRISLFVFIVGEIACRVTSLRWPPEVILWMLWAGAVGGALWCMYVIAGLARDKLLCWCVVAAAIGCAVLATLEWRVDLVVFASDDTWHGWPLRLWWTRLIFGLMGLALWWTAYVRIRRAGSCKPSAGTIPPTTDANCLTGSRLAAGWMVVLGLMAAVVGFEDVLRSRVALVTRPVFHFSSPCYPLYSLWFVAELLCMWMLSSPARSLWSPVLDRIMGFVVGGAVVAMLTCERITDWFFPLWEFPPRLLALYDIGLKTILVLWPAWPIWIGFRLRSWPAMLLLGASALCGPKVLTRYLAIHSLGWWVELGWNDVAAGLLAAAGWWYAWRAMRESSKSPDKA